MTDIPLQKHVYQVSFKDETTKTSIKVIAFDEADAKAIIQRQRPKAVIAEAKKIAE